MDYTGKTILITGGTGTVGKELTRHFIKNDAKYIKIVSRNELNQVIFRRELVDEFGKNVLKRVHFSLCDIRNNEIFSSLFVNCDIVVHTAALKHIDLCEENIEEAIGINIGGTLNVVKNSIEYNVEKAVLMSTDKACSPTSVYGSTKLICEREFIDANKYGSTIFSVMRCGNISGSNGSVIPFFRNKVLQGCKALPITDPVMSRFWITARDVAKTIDYILENMIGREVFIPKMPSFKIVDLALAISNQNNYEVVGLRKGEKVEETILNDEVDIYENDEIFIEINDCKINYEKIKSDCRLVKKPIYTTAKNKKWITVNEIREKLKEI